MDKRVAHVWWGGLGGGVTYVREVKLVVVVVCVLLEEVVLPTPGPAPAPAAAAAAVAAEAPIRPGRRCCSKLDALCSGGPKVLSRLVLLLRLLRRLRDDEGGHAP